jgi:DNA-directed RNA polymerase subunit alpha
LRIIVTFELAEEEAPSILGKLSTMFPSVKPSIEKQIDKAVWEMATKLSAGIEELELSIRTYNCLKRAGVNYIQEIYRHSEDTLLSIRNWSTKSTDELQEKLREFGLPPVGKDRDV